MTWTNEKDYQILPDKLEKSLQNDENLFRWSHSCASWGESDGTSCYIAKRRRVPVIRVAPTVSKQMPKKIKQQYINIMTSLSYLQKSSWAEVAPSAGSDSSLYHLYQCEKASSVAYQYAVEKSYVQWTDFKSQSLPSLLQVHF